MCSSDLENAAAVKAYNAAFFAPRVPDPKFTADVAPEACHRTIDNLYNPPPAPPSDYERSIDKSYDDLMELPPPKKGKQVPQLREQDAQLDPRSSCLMNKKYIVLPRPCNVLHNK